MPTDSYELKKCSTPISLLVTSITQELQLLCGNDCPISAGLIYALAKADLEYKDIITFINHTTSTQTLEAVELYNGLTRIIEKYQEQHKAGDFSDDDYRNAFTNQRVVAESVADTDFKNFYRFNKQQVPVVASKFPFKELDLFDRDGTEQPNLKFAREMVKLGEIATYQQLRKAVQTAFDNSEADTDKVLARLTHKGKLAHVTEAASHKTNLGTNTFYLRPTKDGERIFRTYSNVLYAAYEKYLELIGAYYNPAYSKDENDIVYSPTFILDLFDDAIHFNQTGGQNYRARGANEFHPYRRTLIRGVLQSLVVSQMSGR